MPHQPSLDASLVSVGEGARCLSPTTFGADTLPARFRQVDEVGFGAYRVRMINIEAQPLKGYRFPRSIIAYAVSAYHQFAFSLLDVEDLLAERSVVVSYETIRA